MTSIVVATPDAVGDRMAGPGIRAWHLALGFRDIGAVTLVGRWNGAGRPEGVESLEWGSAAATASLGAADVIIGQPHRALLGRRFRARRVYDLFDPVVLELDELYSDSPRMRQRLHQRLEWARLERALDEGDVLVAATPRQRDFYWGIQRSRRSIHRSWIDRWCLVPFGVEQHDVRPPMSPPRVVWGGGVWGWLDPELAIDAAPELHERAAVRLVFAGGSRPGGGAASPRLAELRERSERAGAAIDWIDDWLPYRDRWSALEGARVALALHKKTVEAEFSIRIRLFDAIGAAVPIVASAGGFVADLVSLHGLGLVVEPGSRSEVVSAVERLCLDDRFHAECSGRLRALAPEYSWSRVVEPLVRRVAEVL